MEQDRELRVLEFVKIRERLTEHALTELGKGKCLALKPSSDFSQVQHMLDETEEASVFLTYLGGHPLVAFPDVRQQVTLAHKGACLSPRALMDVSACLRAARAARLALVKEREDTPILTGLASRLTA
ncbi:MAG: endonuclease MutS2, partial [Clostridia bacterium]